MVICFEVLIHQETEEAYRTLIDFLAQKTIGSLLVSGYAADLRRIPCCSSMNLCRRACAGPATSAPFDG
jgi:hypothetical protein